MIKMLNVKREGYIVSMLKKSLGSKIV